MNNVNRFRDQIAAGHICTGTAVTLNDPAVSELLAEAGYDFTWIDTEHAPFDLQGTLGHIMACRGTNTAPFVRVRENDANLIKPVLDLCPAGIIVPNVNSPEAARAAVQACKYPPHGIRGYGPRRGIRYGAQSMSDYLGVADRQTLVILQIEHIDAVNQIDAILAVPGIDSICIGPNDLSGSMGKLGKTTDPELVRAIELVATRTRRAGVTLGVSTGYNAETLPIWIDRGVQWINLNVDWVNLFLYSKSVVDAVRQVKRTPAINESTRSKS